MKAIKLHHANAIEAYLSQGMTLTMALKLVGLKSAEYTMMFKPGEIAYHSHIIAMCQEPVIEPLPYVEAAPSTIEALDEYSPELERKLLSNRHREYAEYFETKSMN